jgi:hypothetical protein
MGLGLVLEDQEAAWRGWIGVLVHSRLLSSRLLRPARLGSWAVGRALGLVMEEMIVWRVYWVEVEARNRLLSCHQYPPRLGSWQVEELVQGCAGQWRLAPCEEVNWAALHHR